MKINKPVKITVNGRHQRYVDLHRTAWGRFWFKVKLWTRRGIRTAVFGGFIYGIFLLGGSIQSKALATTVFVDNLTPKIEGLKNSLVEDIRNCERSTYDENDAPIILDTNKKMSIGTFMYQKATVQHYYKTLYNQTITPKEAVLIALDEEKARTLTYDIIFKDSKGWRNWYNCGVKVGATERLKIINELSK